MAANSPSPGNPEPSSAGGKISAHDWSQVRSAILGLSYGTVTISIQDGVVVQIDVTNKIRLR
jgi:hypothetical protein